ncbi:YkgJ family cysteine cluster protein [Halobaculum rubrum]|uniref:YkgJ family cysteine cluster protein n=1 Tax=Halobaculum rubrum TaxID=2872158 RepID=UPI001CA40EA0|nr:YkgJ family cysteine cluster protein [Halobaculum rubrum]QZY01171.1 YkgJ family cysteine cluster protein [Halobaculum rubrum]
MSREASAALCADECGSACCTGGAYLRPADADRLRAAGHETAVADDGRRTATGADGACQLLDEEGHCTVYDDRPLDCRLFPLGFVLDDESAVVRIVLVGCPLSSRYSSDDRRELVSRARALLAKFDATELRRYDDLPFTGEHNELATIAYDTLPHDL